MSIYRACFYNTCKKYCIIKYVRYNFGSTCASVLAYILFLCLLPYCCRLVYEVNVLKPDIHPKIDVIEVKCACGATYSVLSTRKEMKLDLCSACHPFFTGRRTIVDTTGRVEKFERRAALAAKDKKEK